MSDLAERLRQVPAEVLVTRFDGVSTQAGKWCHEAAARITALEAEVAELRKDAERYRFLRANSIAEADHGDKSLIFHCDFEHWDDVDAAIDAAIDRSRNA